MRLVIALLILLFSISVFAQKTGKPINSGFVFIDGKYIEPPYVFAFKNDKIELNGIPIIDKIEKWMGNNPTIKKFPGYIPNIYESGDKAINHINPKTNSSMLIDIVVYYMDKFDEFEAYDSIVNYVCNIEGVYCGKETPLIVRFKNDEQAPTLGISYLSIYGKGQNLSYKQKSENIIRKYNQKLLNGGSLFFKDKKLILSLANTELSKELIFNDSTVFLININYEKLNEKLKEKGMNIIQKRFLIDKNESYNNQLIDSSKAKSGILKKRDIASYSPAKKNVIYVCPYTFDYAFNNQAYQTEINLINSKLSQYGYDNTYSYLDETDDQMADIPLNWWKDLSAGVIFISAHGIEESISTFDMAGTLITYFDNYSDAIDYKQSESLLNIDLLRPNTDINILKYCVIATEQWWDNYTKQRFNENNSLVFMGTCYSDRVIDDVGGAAVFGFNNEVTIPEGLVPLENVLEYMIGENEHGIKRMAYEAKNNTSNNKLVLFPTTSELTLCPATAGYLPMNNQTVNSLNGDGYFEVDTWCDASISLNPDNTNSPISFTSNNNCVISQLQWDNVQNGKSNMISFHYSASFNGQVDVHINHEKFQSAPSFNEEYHLLDFNKEAPNTEDGDYRFYINSSTILHADFTANNTNIVVNNSVTFTDNSQGSITSWQWTFQGGTPATSTEQNPTVNYSTPGYYDVSLTVSNGSETTTEFKDNYISVADYSANNYQITGQVKNQDSYTPVPNATINTNDENIASATSGSDGSYSITVPQGWTGNISASKQGYTLSYAPLEFENVSENLSGNTIWLNILPQTNITCNVQNPTTCTTQIKFEVHYTPIGSTTYWYDNGNYIIQGIVCNLTSLEYGSHTITATTIVGNNTSTSVYNLFVDECSINYSFTMSQDCYFTNINTLVHFYETSSIPNELKPELKRDWTFAHGSSDEDNSAPKKSFDECPVYDISHSFSTIGHKNNKLSYWSKRNNWSTNYNKLIETVWFGIDIINCEMYSFYSQAIQAFTDAVRNDWANSWGGPSYIYGGSFGINGSANSYLNAGKITVSACKEIIIDGNQDFIAFGNNELILEINNSPCLGNNYSYSSQINQSELNETLIIKNISCFPNPFTDLIKIYCDLSKEQNVDIKITDMQGVEYFCNSEVFIEGTHLMQIYTANLPKGTYVVSAYNDTFYKSFKIVKNEE